MSKADIQKNLEEVENTLKQIFGARLDRLAEIDKKRIDIANSIGDDKNFVKVNRDLALVLLIAEAHRDSKGNSKLFLRNLQTKKLWIEGFRNELSKSTLKQLERVNIEFGSEDTLNVFRRLYAVILNVKGDKETVTTFLKTHNEEFESALSNLRNKRIANKVSELILRITNQEVNYLTRYLAEVESWEGKEAIREDVQFFITETQAFLYGRDRMHFGLISYFKDEKFQQMILRNPRFLQLTRYTLQLIYLSRLRKKVESYESGDWKEFNEFYRDIGKISANFEKHFGNTEIAADLIAEKERIREYPQKWLEYLDIKISKINSNRYRRSNVILPFIGELEQIFQLRLRELSAMGKPEISDLSEQLEMLLKSHAKLEKNIEESIIKEASAYKKKIMKKIESLKYRFESLSTVCVDNLFDFTNMKIEFIDNTLKPLILLRLKRAKAFVSNEGQFINHALRTIGNDLESAPLNFMRISALLYDFDKAGRASIGTTKSPLATPSTHGAAR